METLGNDTQLNKNDEAAKDEASQLLSELELRSKHLPKEIAKYLKENQSTYKDIKDKSDTEIIETVQEEIRKGRIVFIYISAFVATAIGFVAVIGSESLLFGALLFSGLFAIWLHPERQMRIFAGMLQRLKNPKKYPTRIICGLLIILTGSFILSGIYLQREDKKLYEIPTITVESPVGLQKDSNYNLIVSVTGEKSLKVNGELIAKSGSGYAKMVKIEPLTFRVSIEAINPYYSTIKEIVISRPKTDAELKIDRLAEQEAIKAKEEAARIEKQRKEEKAKAEKARLAKERAVETKRLALQKQYEQLCKYGYLYEIKSRLLQRNFLELDSGFSKAPDGSTQVASKYQKDDGDYRINIELQSSYDLQSHFYTVGVEYLGSLD